VPEVPAYEHVGSVYRGKGDVEGVVRKLRRDDLCLQIGPGEFGNLRRVGKSYL
jgi:hypothetical protein